MAVDDPTEIVTRSSNRGPFTNHTDRIATIPVQLPEKNWLPGDTRFPSRFERSRLRHFCDQWGCCYGWPYLTGSVPDWPWQMPFRPGRSAGAKRTVVAWRVS
jgi:hypothetical protein